MSEDRTISRDGKATVGRPHYRTVDTSRGPLRVPTLDHPLVAAFVASDRYDGPHVEGAVARMLFKPNAGGLTLTDALAALGYGHGPGDHNRRHIYRGGDEVAMLAALDVWPWLRERVIEQGMVPARLREGGR